MIDLHCHLLPGIDDGAQSLEDAVAMARVAHESGITRAVLTPHIFPGRFENTAATISAATQRLAEALASRAIPLDLGWAAEVHIGPEIITLVDSGEMPYLGALEGYSVMLLEFPDSHILPGTDKLISWLLARKVRPLIAHPERNKDVMRNVDKIAPYVSMGCLLQVTAGSAAGVFGPAVLKTTNELLERGWVSILASDAHNLGARKPDLEPGRAAAERIIGSKAAWALVRETPLAISESQFAEAVD
jgi:protein-tyrosine phosphatase